MKFDASNINLKVNETSAFTITIEKGDVLVNEETRIFLVTGFKENKIVAQDESAREVEIEFNEEFRKKYRICGHETDTMLYDWENSYKLI